ncbi:hypothetical protein CNX65_24160 [Actinosynnema pretiosum]|uniref:Uncharacterized protein n=1 Tax=Actinosynnema pretiosum TaxID=42197 RepID=A0A290ZAH4_9PSEU|nr:hypothetical protein CNX65_24160 [Actinosynnema pretiosum]
MVRAARAGSACSGGSSAARRTGRLLPRHPVRRVAPRAAHGPAAPRGSGGRLGVRGQASGVRVVCGRSRSHGARSGPVSPLAVDLVHVVGRVSA